MCYNKLIQLETTPKTMTITATTMIVNPSQVLPRNFVCGDVLYDRATGNQFAVVDFVGGQVHLQQLTNEEKSKPEFTDGTVVFFEEEDYREPGNAEPDAVTISHQIEGEYDKNDPEDFYGNNYVPGLS